jgi:hypothetical protein
MFVLCSQYVLFDAQGCFNPQVVQLENETGLISRSVILRSPTFAGFQYLDSIGPGNRWGGVMTEHTQLAMTPRDRFLEAAQKELAAFERREREFSKKERQERAVELQMPVQKSEFHS